MRATLGARLSSLACQVIVMAACRGAPLPEGAGACSGWAPEENTYDLTPDRTFPVGPVVLNVSATSVEIMWEADPECAGSVRYGLRPGEWIREIASTAVQGVHRAWLQGLEPGGRYFYPTSAIFCTNINDCEGLAFPLRHYMSGEL